MLTQITARNFQASPALREYVDKRVSKLERFYDGIVHARVVMTKPSDETGTHEAEVTLEVFRQNLTATAQAETHEQAVDECVDRLRRQVLKYKERLRSTDKDVHR
ncbi:MAG: ribosome-associated translation inhibitor RaiA [Bacteroidota bacterium]